MSAGLPTGGAGTMTNKPNRRGAFATIAGNYPIALRGLMQDAGLSHPEKSAEREAAAWAVINAPDYVARGVRFLSGQFAARILATRASIERTANGGVAGPLDKFQAGAVARLLTLSDDALDGFSVQVSEKAERALRVVEGDLAAGIFDSLMFQVGQAAEFEEADFWLDVFRGIGDADHTGQVVRGFQAVFLDHAEDYRHLLRTLSGAHALDLPTRH